MNDEELQELRNQLDGVAERLGELIMEEVRSAIQAGEGKRTDMDKRLTRARASIEKAAHLLTRGDT
jgi:hypothetical protein